MPKESCIQHIRRADFIVLRKHMVELFDGDHCAAVVMAYFEYATNGEMDRLSRQNDGEGVPFAEQPWVKASMSSVHEETLNLYGLKALQDRIAWLVRIGLLQEAQASIGKIKRYLLNVDGVNDAIAKGTVFSIGKTADEISHAPSAPSSAPLSAPPSAKPTHEDGEKNLKGEEERSTKEENTSPLPHDSDSSEKDLEVLLIPDLYPQDPVEKFVQDAYNREHRIRLKFRKSDKPLMERLQEREASMGKATFRRALLAYLADDANWLKEKDWPIFVFLKDPSRWETEQPAPARIETMAVRPLPETEAAPPPPAPDFPARWNAIVTAAPVQSFATAGIDRVRVRAYSDPVFIERFDEMCHKVQAILLAKDDCGWLSYHWTLRMDHDAGVFNWQKILNGNFDWMLKKSKASQKESVISGDPFVELRLKQEERRKNGEAKVQG